MTVLLDSWSLLLFLCLASAAAATQTAPTAQSPNTSKFDGPAELPRIYIKSGLVDTPAPGKTVFVQTGDDLQKALDDASCGDTVKLEAGTSFAGRFKLPKKSCDDTHWIIIRTSAPDNALPPEGTRIAPCYAGVAALPGRPAFHCASDKNVMAKLTYAGRNELAPLVFSDGANHYRFIGLEITRDPSEASIASLAAPDGPVAADHIIFDRVWMHGNAQDETRRGLFLSGTTYMAVVDSFFSDFHCIAREGSCVDAQTIAGGSGDLPMGPFKIVNNFLEASGENLMFGGSRATHTPTDIEIRHNYLFKPIIWMRGEPGFAGGPKGNPFIVKNLFELKNAQRVLFEGNLLENSWGGFSQTGFAMVLTPRNVYNGPGRGNLCPTCLVTDVTIRDCVISHVGSGFLIANPPNPDGTAAAAGERYSIHDLIFDDIDGTKYAGFGAFMVLISNQPTLKDVRFDHITAVTPRVLMNVGVMSEQAHIRNFVFTNNLIGAYGSDVTGTGGQQNCVYNPQRQQPAGIFMQCFISSTVTNNVIVNGFAAWPAGNFLAKNAEAVGFVRGGKGLDAFRLCREKGPACKNASKYINAGSDHKDIGADVDSISSAIRGVIE